MIAYIILCLLYGINRAQGTFHDSEMPKKKRKEKNILGTPAPPRSTDTMMHACVRIRTQFFRGGGVGVVAPLH